MACFWYFSALIMAFMASPLLAFPSQPNPKATTISSSSSFLTTTPPQSISPFQELTPDIAPLLPSPGGKIPSATGFIPTIPSNPSPPNPDEFEALGPDSAPQPFGLPASFAAARGLAWCSNLPLLAGLAVYFYLLIH